MQLMNIVADRAIPYIQHFFSPLGDLRLYDGREINSEVVNNADVLLVRTITRIDEELLDNSPLRFVGSVTSGVDHVDGEYLAAREIEFAYAPGCNARSVAEYVLSSLFVLADQTDIELCSKQVGVVGCGHAGSQLMAFLKVLGINTIACDPPLKDGSGDNSYVGLEAVLAADIISLHVPLTTSGAYPTFQMVDADFLNQLKSDVVLINTSRGEVIDEQALLRFMSEKSQAHLVLDVWAGEPHINPGLLQAADINTPHIAGYSADGKLRGTQMIYQQLCEHFALGQEDTVLPVLPHPELSEINLSAVDNEMAVIQKAVLSAYDVRSDSVSLQRILELDEPKRAGFFSELRNNYPVRREFSSLRVKLDNTTRTLQSMLSGLGFAGETGAL